MNTTLRRDDTAIARLHLRGPTRACARLQQELANIDWPSVTDNSWVIIRQVHARAHATQLAAKVIDTTRQWLDRADSPDHLIRFADLSDLLAHLLTDLAHGRAAQRWYWQRWRALFTQPKSTAITQLLGQHLLLLPAITSRLQQHQTLPLIWRQLDARDAGELLARFLQQLNLTASWQRAAQPRDDAALNHVHVSPAQRERWAAIVSANKAGDPRQTLALLVLAQEAAPLVLQHTPQALLALLAAGLGAHGQAPTATRPVRQPPAPTPRSHATASPSRTIANETAAVTPPLSPRQTTATTPPAQPDVDSYAGEVRRESAPDVGASAILVDSATPQANAADAHRNHEPLPATNAAAMRQPPVPPPEKAAPSVSTMLVETPQPPSPPDIATAGFLRFQTEQGGLWYLLNFLNRPELQHLMAQHWSALPNGWAWLYRLGNELALNEADPICDFLASQLALPEVNGLQALPPLPARSEILQWALRWYGGRELWQPSLLQLPAQLHCTPSHCDWFASSSRIRLAVRLAGLDINPGWLPWLGRVVTFHYQS